ncbi:OCEL1 protein, partial [Corythaixoides concolor]|nr:OCEL1 protein [Corythaixoides concolor]
VWGSCTLTPLLCVLKPLPARARRVIFQDEVMPLGKVAPTKDGEKPGAGSIPPGLAPWPHAVPDYVVKYPAIRSPRQREAYKGVFQDQLAEYTELLGEIRATRRSLGGLEDLAFLEKQQRCEYLKKKLTHIKARIQEYDRDAGDGSVYF